ncbi:MAG TPA: hypothetical protein VKR60_11365 [Candidatus Sulfotelmatobacter sp.]|nr:hypothetical protein [Candidatus Sulfotelmatobacter sp.]
MRNQFIVALCLIALGSLTACSPRDLLSRRLAADLIEGADVFKGPQAIFLRTGMVSNKDYLSPESLVLQHHGWISATTAPCPPGLAPPPCWDVVLTPSGVETVRSLLAAADAGKPSFSLPAARRELVAVTGVSKQGSVADVDFIWRWQPLNEVGAALYPGDLHYRSTVGFRNYDDGWRVVQTPPRSGQTLDDALKNAEPEP